MLATVSQKKMNTYIYTYINLLIRMESKQFMNNNEIYNAFYGKFNIANWFSYNAFIELAEYL